MSYHTMRQTLGVSTHAYMSDAESEGVLLAAGLPVLAEVVPDVALLQLIVEAVVLRAGAFAVEGKRSTIGLGISRYRCRCRSRSRCK